MTKLIDEIVDSFIRYCKEYKLIDDQYNLLDCVSVSEYNNILKETITIILNNYNNVLIVRNVRWDRFKDHRLKGKAPEIIWTKFKHQKNFVDLNTPIFPNHIDDLNVMSGEFIEYAHKAYNHILSNIINH